MFTPRKVRARTSKAGLSPFNPVRVLGAMQYLTAGLSATNETTNVMDQTPQVCNRALRMPTIVTSVSDVRRRLETKLGVQDSQSKL